MSVEPGQSSGGPAEDPAGGPAGGGRRFSALIGSLAAATSHDQGDQDGSGRQGDTGGQEAPATRPTFTARTAEPGAAGVPGVADAPGAGEPGRDTVPGSGALAAQAAPGNEPTPPAPGLPAMTLDEPLLSDADRLRARWQAV